MSELAVYAAYLLAANLTCMVFISLVLGQYGVLEEALRSFPFFIKYTTINTVFALILPFIVYMIRKNIKVSAGVEENEKS